MERLGVAEAKQRFSELADRVGRGETFIVARRGVPAVALVPPHLVPRGTTGQVPTGLAAMAGELAEWDDIEDDVAQIVADRQHAEDRPPPTFE